ncbi:DUF2231 domain-containing protein [Sphingosinicella rhizophila]|uniref:DUF2231 domain-containing protein n=1 Tax=Sphingosinicella rhizophila TaxID=3050082 RepID=A0ABU3Q6J3_9SPHN|nr:DUF2231 domain-containing protein [Sphingosinicella sp. GR2756]MDT9598922.1 DUF2231 domain-containing protein [Sphingosinicella sp. GR2756]
MAATIDSAYPRTLHPVHAALLAFSVPLFLGAALSDFAYLSSYQVQWTNFASWLMAGGLVFCGFALLWAIVDLLRADRRGKRALLLVLLLLATWVLGFINALIHSRDAWGSMPAGLILSAIVAGLILLATWIGFATFRADRTR